MLRHLLWMVLGDFVYNPCKKVFHKSNWKMGDPLFECDRPKGHKGRHFGEEITTDTGE